MRRLSFLCLTLIFMLLIGGFPELMKFPPHLKIDQEPLQGDLIYQSKQGSGSRFEDTVEVLAVGDILLGRGVSLENSPFRHLQTFLAVPDFTIGNFEGVISSDYPHVPNELEAPSGPIRLIAVPSSVSYLQRAGFDLVNLANNHSRDGTNADLTATILRLKRAGIAVAGTRRNTAAHLQPVMMRLHGVKIAFLGINAVNQPDEKLIQAGGNSWQISSWNRDQVQAAIQHARSASDIVVVLVHWGDEYETRASPSQKEAARLMIESGADLVIGSHPHVIQETEMFEVEEDAGTRIGFAAYSLGNFVFDQTDPRSKIGLILKMRLNKKGIQQIQAFLVESGPAPRLIPVDQSSAVLERIRPTPKPIRFACREKTCWRDQTAVENTNREGVFKAGAADLTGDGVVEIVRQISESIEIYEEQKLVWKSPLDWRILDAALGDPNGDGREEVVLALQKHDSQGILKSHPFLIGYRGGQYRQVWGGSAVHFPILELELADLDLDRVPELFVLEERSENMRAITVWRWQGWVFTQIWSSPEGHYSNLRVIPNLSGKAVIEVDSDWK